MLGAPALAADDDGEFAIRGAGLQTCGALLAAFDGRTRDLSLYAGWIDGYVTGLNQFTEDTFEIASWQTSETLLGLTRSICLQAPDDTRFMDAFFQVVRLITPSRMSTASPLVALVHEGQSTVAYAEVIMRIKARLRDLGHGQWAEDDAVFDSATATALAAFQTAEGLDATGLPDQQTLFHLFRSR